MFDIRRRRAGALAAALSLAAVGCATNPSRPPLRPDPEQVPQSYLGAWIAIDRGQPDHPVEGELLALDSWRVHVRTVDGRVEQIDRGSIVQAKLYEYGASTGIPAAWTVLGIASIATHGVFLIISGPIWLLTGTVATATESRHIRLRSPPTELESFRPWARYPQGMPP